MRNQHNGSRRQPYSNLFTVRLWPVETEHGQQTLCIQVKHVLSGETRACQRWSELVAFLQSRIGEPPAGPAADPDLP